MLEHLIRLRHELHRHPEVSGQEQQTAERIKNYLLLLQPDELLTEVGGHGIVATFDSGQPGSALLFRAELDALPIQEINTFAHRSGVEGVSHKCGHDGHATILCGLAESLAKNKPRRGKVHLLFQPAEETGTGAAAILADPKFTTVKPDMGIALHNFPHHKLGSLMVKDGIPALHNPDYDFPDMLIETGLKLFDGIVRKQLG
jgi:amidohydrolase